MKFSFTQQEISLLERNNLQIKVLNWILDREPPPPETLICRNKLAIPLPQAVADRHIAEFRPLLLALRSGFTIIFKNIESEYNEKLYKIFGYSKCNNINIYASINCLSGIGWHSDPYDILAIQLVGSKIWKFENEPSQLILNQHEMLLVQTGELHLTVALAELSIHATLHLVR